MSPLYVYFPNVEVMNEVFRKLSNLPIPIDDLVEICVLLSLDLELTLDDQIFLSHENYTAIKLLICY